MEKSIDTLRELSKMSLDLIALARTDKGEAAASYENILASVNAIRIRGEDARRFEGDIRRRLNIAYRLIWLVGE